MNTDYDVIIVGAGPAGSIAGMTLIHSGYKVLIIDKSTFPRDKFCGGGISLRTFQRFPSLTKGISAIPVNYVHKVCIQSPNGTMTCEEREKPLYAMVRRWDFDTMLLNTCKKGGIEVFEGHKVIEIEYHPDSIEVITNTGKNMTAKLLIGADGVHSIIAKKTGLYSEDAAGRLAIDFMEESPYEHLPLDTQDTMYIFYGFKNFSGYGYVFPKKDHLNIGIGFLWSFFQNKIQEKPYKIYSQFIDFLREHEVVQGQPQRRNFHGYFVPIGGPLPKTYASRVLLCGDAAGFVNAFSAEGIYYAMVSGEHTAKTALQALHQNNFSEEFLSTYQTNWQEEIGKELEISVKIQQELFQRHHLIDFIVKSAKNDASLRRALTDYVLGELDYRGLKKQALLHLTPFYLKHKSQKFLRFFKKLH